ncbi:MAG TPA: R3H domain-containing nucleic acid-binding protein [Pyrinomonadaceae bacterium]|nr:R3H domain-containing nucleic acid-binding protein [Pyrinomonadaceae bacterium]
MEDTCDKAASFLGTVFEGAELSLEVSLKESRDGCILDLRGQDAEMLQAAGGELLEAVQHLVNQAFGRDLPRGQRLVCDVHGFRATREAELRAMAQHAADRVRATGLAFVFGPMNSNERRIIHMTLADNPDLFTESIGEGAGRRLRVSLKDN